MKRSAVALAIALICTAAASAAGAQEQAPQPISVGMVAPDFALPGATRFGVLKQPVHLSDFKGKTAVLAFFYKARSSG